MAQDPERDARVVALERAGTPAPTIGRHPIRRAATLAGLHPQTLRDYERRGLIRPARTDGGMRLYSDEDITRARRLSELTSSGVPLEAARRMLRLERLLHLTIDRIHALEEQNRRLSTRLQALTLE